MRNYSVDKTIKTIGIDLAKSSFQVHGVDEQVMQFCARR